MAVETPSVTGATDQVDVNVTVTEKPTGNILLGAGFSSGDGLILSGAISQSNVFGSGNQLGIQLNSSKVNRVYALSFTDPYFTVDGVSRGFDVYQRNVDPTSINSGRWRTSTLGATVRFGVPVTESDVINYGIGAERTDLTVFSDSPERFLDFANTFGTLNSTLLGTVGWARDRRDSLIYPTRGNLQRLTGEIGLPGGSLRYYKLSYQAQSYLPLTRYSTLMVNGELGAGKGLNGKPLPFFKNFYAGGVTSVRGFQPNSLGNKDGNGDAIGGSRRAVANAELLFPFPGLQNDRSVRVGWFFDTGLIGDSFDGSQLRASTGLSVLWISPLGPLKLSAAHPFRTEPGDRVQRFQFTFGSAF